MNDNDIQVIGNPMKMSIGAEPVMRPMRLDDLEDDCWICQQNRARILAGDPPMALVFE